MVFVSRCFRKLAKEIAKQDWRRYLKEASGEKSNDQSAHEEIMLQGLVIGYAKMSTRGENVCFR